MNRKIPLILLIVTIISFVLDCPAVNAIKRYQSGEILSRNAVTYGKFDIVMKPAEGEGIISSFFLFKTLKHPKDQWREIDIEVLGAQPNVVSTNLIAHRKNRTGNTQTHDMGFNLTSGFHTYTIEWTPDEISWYINGELIRKANVDIVKQFQGQELTMRFNLWPTNLKDWAGEFSEHILPVEHTVQSITYYRYTPDKEFKGKPFTYAWTDSFDSIKITRWEMADWSFDENLSQFNPKNISIEDGKLKIKLTPSN